MDPEKSSSNNQTLLFNAEKSFVIIALAEMHLFEKDLYFPFEYYQGNFDKNHIVHMQHYLQIVLYVKRT